METSAKIIGVSILLLMFATYISFFAGLSFWHLDFVKFLRYIELPYSGWYFLDEWVFNGAL